MRLGENPQQDFGALAPAAAGIEFMPSTFNQEKPHA
jgi:hypothetical protein